MTVIEIGFEQSFRLVPPPLPEDGQIEPSVPFSWCTSRETAQMLQDIDAKDIYVMLVVEQDGREIARHLIPIKEQMRYIVFRSPGKNVVHATLVWRKEIDPNDQSAPEEQRDHYKMEPRRVLTNKDDHGNFITQLIADTPDRWYGNCHLRTDFDSVERLDTEDSITVDVPDEMFARSWWITRSLGTLYGERWFGKKAKDQCSMRRRAILTGVSLPIAAAAAVVVAAVAAAFAAVWIVGVETYYLFATAVQTLFGLRNIHYGAFLHPFDEDIIKGRWKGLDRSVWIFKKVTTDEKVSYESRHPALLFLNPASISIAALISAAAMGLNNGSPDYVIDGIVAAVALGVLILTLSLLGISPIGRWLSKKLDERARRKREEDERLFREELELLACDNRSTVAIYDAVPKKRRTVKLRYQHTKAKLCRPFAA